MSRSALRSSNPQYLQATLAVTIGQVRSLHARLAALVTEVAAIRRTLMDEPGNAAEYRNNLMAALETAHPLIDEAMESYDEMLDELSAPEEWSN